jgi:hypothetical protein
MARGARRAKYERTLAFGEILDEISTPEAVVLTLLRQRLEREGA